MNLKRRVEYLRAWAEHERMGCPIPDGAERCLGLDRCEFIWAVRSQRTSDDDLYAHIRAVAPVLPHKRRRRAPRSAGSTRPDDADTQSVDAQSVDTPSVDAPSDDSIKTSPLYTRYTSSRSADS
jgi:hypothetical protein